MRGAICFLLAIVLIEHSHAVTVWAGPGGFDPSNGTTDAMNRIYAYTATESGVTPSQYSVDAHGLPKWLVSDRSGSTLFAASNPSQGAGAVASFRIAAGTAHLQFLSRALTNGSNVVHMALDTSERWLLAASYNGGSITVHPVASTGHVGAYTSITFHTGHGPDPSRQLSPHPHCIVVGPRGNDEVQAK